MRALILKALVLASTISTAAYAQTERQDALLHFDGQQLRLSDFVQETLPRLLWAGTANDFLHVVSQVDGEKVLRLGRQVDGSWQTSLVGEFGRRALETPRWHAASKRFFLISDTKNSEDSNLHRLDPVTGEIVRLTDFSLLRRFSFSARQDEVLFAARRGPVGTPFCIYALDAMAASTPAELACDDGPTGEYQFIEFYAPLALEDHRTVAVAMTRRNSRADTHLALLDRATGVLKLITPEAGPKRNKMHLLASRGDGIFFVTQDAQTQSLMRFDIRSQSFTTIYEYQAAAMQIGNEGAYDATSGRVVFEEQRGNQRFATIFDLEAGAVLARLEISSYRVIWFLGVQSLEDGTMVVGAQDANGRGRYALGLRLRDPIGLSVLFEPESNHIQNAPCPFEIVHYPSFDTLPDGSPRMIEGVLFLPKGGKPPRGGLIFAHGGPSARTTAAWNADIQIPCHLGYAVFGPNPRGSSGFGKAFEDLNNHDWGGGDYLDYEYGRRYLAERFQLPDNTIGIYGFSYGGYMTNWALTQPESKFAFGIASAGPADLTTTAKGSTVGMFVMGEMGDPEVNSDLYRQRSPMTHARELKAPLLLVHGSSDNRVPTSESRRFYQLLQELGKEVSYLELPEEGHSIQYLSNQKLYYQTLLDFLSRQPQLSEHVLAP